MSDFYKINDNKLRDKLTDHEFAKMPGAWEQMEQMLQAEPATAIKTGALYWWSLPLAAAAVFSGIITVGLYFSQPATPKVEAIAANKHMLAAGQGALGEKGLIPGFIFSKENIRTALTKPQVKEIATTSQEATTTTTTTTTNTTTNTAFSKTSKVAETNDAVAVNEKSTDSPTDLPPTIMTSEQEMASTALPLVEEEEETPNTSNFPVKKSRTVVLYQYSATPLKALMQRRKGVSVKDTKEIGAFGVSNENQKSKTRFKLKAFAGVSTKLIGSTKKVSVMPAAGLSVGYKLSPKHSVQAGLQYKAISLNGMNNSDEYQGYRSFQEGATTMKAYTIDRLDVLELPLTYEYMPHPKLCVQAGIKGAWVFNKSANNHSAMAKMSNTSLGIANFDLGMLFGVEVFLHKNISVGLQYSLGLMNLMQNANQMHQQLSNDVPQHSDRSAKLANDGESLTPIADSNDEMLRLPTDMRNSDLQLLVKYSF